MATLFAEGFGFLEGPRWHDGKLWVSDIGRYEVLTIDEEGNRETIVAVPERPSGLGFLPDGTPLVASMMDRKIFRIVNGGLELHADLSEIAPHFINDMVVDRQGRAYVDNVEINPFLPGFKPSDMEGRKPGSIVLVETDGTARIVAEDTVFPNGMLITQDGRLVVNESFVGRVSSFAIAGDGSLSDRRTELQTDGRPDGCCLDQDGAFWIALGSGMRFVRLLNGEITETIAVPGRKAVACQLGGADGKTLFCLTMTADITRVDIDLTSKIETVRVAVGAAGSP